MNIAVCGKRVPEHVSRLNFDFFREAPFCQGPAGQMIHRRLFQNSGAQMRMAGDQCAGVNAGAAGDVEEGMA